MLKNFSFRRKNDTSSVMSTRSSIFDNAPPSPESTYTECGDVVHENNSKPRDYVHHAASDPVSGTHSTPRTFSLKSRSSQSIQEKAVQVQGGSQQKSPSKISSDRDSSLATPSISRRASANLDADSSIVSAKLRSASNMRGPVSPSHLRISSDARASARYSIYTQDKGNRSRSDGYLKIKLTYKPVDEMLALKYSKSKLTSVEDLVNVVTVKLHDRYKLKHQRMQIFMSFSDKSLPKVLLSREGSSPSSCIDPLTMDYIQCKSRIYLEASPTS